MSTIDPSLPVSPATYDIVCLGEVLVEVATQAPFGHDVHAVLGISGDPLNVAASAAAAGARVGLVAVVTDDELGHAIAKRIAELGISTDLLHFATGQQGVYLVHSDPNGEREFAYARSGSIGSSLSPDHLPADVISTAGAVVASGISCAISPATRAAVVYAAQSARRFVYDPNYRSRLDHQLGRGSHAGRARPVSVAGHALASRRDGRTAGCGHRPRRRAPTPGARRANRRGHLRRHGCANRRRRHRGLDRRSPAPIVVDQTGAGDAYVGTLTARLVLGDDLIWAARQAAAASSLVVSGRGGTGFVPTLDQTRRHLAVGGEAVQ